MTNDPTPEQQERLQNMPEPFRDIAIRINGLNAPYCYAVLDAIQRYNHNEDVPESVINAMDSEGLQIWVDFLALMSFVKS